MEKIFQQFFALLNAGDLIQGVQLFLSDPDVRYESLLCNERLFPVLVNYVDASVFGTFQDALLANSYLCNGLMKEGHQFPNVKQIYARLILEKELLEFFLNDGCLSSSFPTPSISSSLLQAAGNYKACFEKQLPISLGWQKFQAKKPSCAFLYAQSYSIFSCPWYPLQYPLTLPRITYEKDHVPLIFFDPMAGDYSKFLAPLSNSPAIFAFDTCALFLQMLQYPDAVDAICDPKHLIYILDLYPNEQFFIQKCDDLRGKSFQVITTVKRKRRQEFLSIFTEAISECINQSYTELESDSESGDWLYQAAKRYLFSIQEERLGVDRAPALIEQWNNKNWQDVHKGLPDKKRNLGPAPADYMKLKLEQLAQLPVAKKRKPKVVHIVPQLVDGGHAPSCLLEALIKYHDHERYDIVLIVSERFSFHISNYPHNFIVSDPSPKRAPLRYQLFQNLGVLIFTTQDTLSYEENARHIAAHLQQIADIAIFHGPDPINCMCAQLLAIPTRVLFEHGTQPAYPGFDVVITSTESALKIYQDLHRSLNVEAKALPFSIDLRANWEPNPYSKAQIGLPENSLVMTTISNHLYSRLSSAMRLSIVEILKRVPAAYYAPIGIITDENKNELIAFFQKHQLAQRIVFLGPVKFPSQVARSMDLYLNEFPFGGCLGMLDAMAAGCPVVTMYDENGPPQARYGGDYFGLDRCIHSGSKEEYVDLACKLLTDPEMHKEWSNIAKSQYEKQADPRAYVKAFEEIIFSHTNPRREG